MSGCEGHAECALAHEHGRQKHGSNIDKNYSTIDATTAMDGVSVDVVGNIHRPTPRNLLRLYLKNDDPSQITGNKKGHLSDL